MLYRIIGKYQKTIAWTLFLVFYLQLISPVLANAAERSSNRQAAWGGNDRFSSGSNAWKWSTDNTADIPVNQLFDLPGNKKSKGAQQKKGQRSTKKGSIGPTQPEMQSFQSANTNNMVDLFSGDFSYNIPLLDVGGYPVNLHYNSGITMDQEASWVGLGWNINPGTINRNMRGLPDDFNGTDKIVKTVSMKPNTTYGVTIGGGAELLGKTLPSGHRDSSGMRLGQSLGIFHNSYNGWGTEIGINARINAGKGAKGNLSGGLSITNNSQSGLDVAPSFSFTMNKVLEQTKGLGITVGTNYNSRVGVQGLQLTMQVRQQANADRTSYLNRFVDAQIGTPVGGTISFATPSFTPGITIPYTSQQFTFTAKVGGSKWVFHPYASIEGSYSNQYIDIADRTQIMPAYGYLYYQEAENQPKALLDFNREKEVAYRGTTPHIAIPSYTYDIYSISGEGTGGMFRPYRGDIGVVYDHVMATKSGSGRASIDLGFGVTSTHVGVDLNKVWASTKNNPWISENIMARYTGFKKQDSLYEPVYFKNPGEKVTVDQEFYDKIGDDKLARVQLTPANGQNSPVVVASKNLSLFSGAKPVGTVTIDQNTYKKQRDKRTQVISYLTAGEAAQFGIDREIRSFGVNSFPTTNCQSNYQVVKRIDSLRKSHHLSEITVLGSDGRRYVYGVPAYNIDQQDVAFAVAKENGNNNTGLVSYTPGLDNTPANNKGKDNFFSNEKIPPYAHSFLLSAIVSPNYVDITGDGVSEDDNGDAVKFNYSRVYGVSNPYRWRAPFDENKASYNEGFKTYSRDDKGSYTYGSKEIWYLNSIESKTMIATFVLDTDSLRKDAYGVKGENGGLSTDQKLYRLKQINLYAKADYLKNGIAGAKPIKSVHFEYSYELCSGVPSATGVGKLTLKKVWFSYNKNYKGKLNPYTFAYHSSNPSFNNKSYDRWGNYKNPDDNPGQTGNKLTNAEYPYTLQKGVNSWDSTKAADSVSAWALKEIKTPAGGLMRVTYESDDYAYVQNRRAMQMFAVEGMGASASATPQGLLYQANSSSNDYRYVFVRLATAVSDKNEITERYLSGVKKLYFKMFVKMPSSKDGDRWGTGYEQIPCFADIEDYGIKTGGDNKTIWIKVAVIKKDRSPMATAAIQYLRLNHPSKAYPYSEPGDNIKLKDVVGMLASVAENVKNSIDGFEDQSRKKNWCNEIDVEKTFVRLNNPEWKKLGGGLRVKKVEIFDNWQKMTGQTEASYGQSYDYSTVALVNNQPTRISSGVASYEPLLGKEENPFYQPIEYAEKMAALGPTDYVFTEEPLGESFFPSAGIGYSKVTVQTINNTKKSANGVDVSEFYTAKDFPTIVEHTPLDNESKKTFANPIGNFLKFDAKRYVTLSQGFKVELNDMHGKVKSQTSYAQTDLKNPISFTQSYYKLDNDNALLNKHLSSKVSTVDSANGIINSNSQMGKEVEMLIDIREQTSKTVSASLELNVDVVKPGVIPVPIPSLPNLPSFETNRYRSIATVKVVNRYAILDSVVNFDKGSKVSTANMVYDGQTGNVLLSRTQNEFDDPIYTFSYPAHWAYDGMGAAARNIGGLFRNTQFSNGRMHYYGATPAELTRFFESGDELIFWGKIKTELSDPDCGLENYIGLKDTAIKIWAIDAAKSNNNQTGIFFIDKDGKPITGYANYVKIIRSGRRNVLGASVGSVTSLKNPMQQVTGVNRIVFDTTSRIINANAAVYKDVWKVDSTGYRKDTVVTKQTRVSDYCESGLTLRVKASEKFTMLQTVGRGYPVFTPLASDFFETFSTSTGCTSSKKQGYAKSWMRFDLSAIPAGSVITSAQLTLSAPIDKYPQRWGRGGSSNAAFIARTTGPWIGDLMALNNEQTSMYNYFDNAAGAEIDFSNRQIVNLTPVPTPDSGPTTSISPASYSVTNMVQDMVNNYYSSNRVNKPAMVMQLQDWGSCGWADTNRMNFAFANGTGFCRPHEGAATACLPELSICYISPCANGTTPVYSATPVPGYYCQSQPIDSSVCKPNINDTATNPYRWGIWGNWQTDRAYVYYGDRKETDPAAATTNIRRDGEISDFLPYWSFTNKWLNPSQDSSRWVWNSEINLINSKGLELQNHDPLDRYNAAQYGYNQTLAVAVGQNTRSREMVFDGFEDYGYRTDTCKNCPSPRFLNLVNTGVLVDSVSHTGLYSLRIAGNQTNSITVPIAANDAPAPAIHITVDSIKVQRTIVNGKGTGLHGDYYHMQKIVIPWLWGLLPDFTSNGYAYELNLCDSRIDSVINFTQWGTESPYPPNCGNVGNKIIWTGYIQPRYTELYRFHATADKRFSIWIGDRRISQGSPIEYTDGTYDLDTISLIAGKLYPVHIELEKLMGGMAVMENLAAVLKWSSPSEPLAVVPKSQLYTNTDTTGTTIKDMVWCVKVNSPQPSHVTHTNFSPLHGRLMLVSAWVRERGNMADTVTQYRNTEVQIVFSNGLARTLKPSGNIIEGWQRIEDTVSIPIGVQYMDVKLKSINGSVPVFFDDVRIHPFNSNVKSFVYSPVNIRLMAELDENNYASFYEYDDDGTLIRVKKETERGIKTIKETRSALLKE